MNLPENIDIIHDPAGLARGWTVVRASRDDKGPLEEWIGRFWDHYPTDDEVRAELLAKGWISRVLNRPAIILEAVYETRDGARLSRQSNEHGDPRDLERYWSPGGELKIRCSTGEREDFERDTELKLTSDVLSADEFERLFRWLKENARLRLFGIFTRANITNTN